MTKIHSQAGLSILSLVKKRRPAMRKSVFESPIMQKFKCACSEVLGILIFTKDAFWPHFDVFARVTGHFVPKLFRTQVIQYLFGHFVPNNYPFRAMSFRYPFGRLI